MSYQRSHTNEHFYIVMSRNLECFIPSSSKNNPPGCISFIDGDQASIDNAKALTLALLDFIKGNGEKVCVNAEIEIPLDCTARNSVTFKKE